MRNKQWAAESRRFYWRKKASRWKVREAVNLELTPAYFLTGSLIFWPTFSLEESTPGLTDWRSAKETPCARATFASESPPLITYSPGPATAGSCGALEPAAAAAAAGF